VVLGYRLYPLVLLWAQRLVLFFMDFEMTIKIKKFVDKGVYSPMGILQYGKTIEGRWIDLCFDPLEVAYYKAIL